MIPFAVLSGELIFPNEKKIEIRILEIATDTFTFRLVNTYNVSKILKINLHFYEFDRSNYFPVSISDFSISQIETTEFYSVYKVHISNLLFSEKAEKLTAEYMRYIELKLAGNDTAMSAELIGYPTEETFPLTLEEWRSQYFNYAKNNVPSELTFDCELAVELNTPSLLHDFINLPWEVFQLLLWKKYGLSWHPFTKKNITTIYIGNQFCPHLFPDIDILDKALKKIFSLTLVPVIQFPPMKEQDIDSVKNILIFLKKYAPELIINDWGMLEMIRNDFPDTFPLTLGLLLNKRRKDVRLPYKNGKGKQLELLKENALHSTVFQKELETRYQITSYSYESCDYSYHFAPGNHVFHLPFYQMNTSGHCTLYATCKNRARSKQTEVIHCPHYCEDKAFFYPKSLPMIGRFNSLFGYDTRILWDRDYLQSFLNQNPKRIVLGVL